MDIDGKFHIHGKPVMFVTRLFFCIKSSTTKFAHLIYRVIFAPVWRHRSLLCLSAGFVFNIGLIVCKEETSDRPGFRPKPVAFAYCELQLGCSQNGSRWNDPWMGQQLACHLRRPTKLFMILHRPICGARGTTSCWSVERVSAVRKRFVHCSEPMPFCAKKAKAKKRSCRPTTNMIWFSSLCVVSEFSVACRPR